MKHRLILTSAFILVLFLSACNNSQNAAEENIRIVEKYQEALKNHDVEGLKALLAEDYVGYGPSIGDSMKRDDAISNWDYNMQHLFKKLEFKRAENIALTNYQGKEKGLWVSSWGKLHVQLKDRGNEATIWANNIYLIDDGKIKKSIIFFNEADALRQAGYHYIFKEPKK